MTKTVGTADQEDTKGIEFYFYEDLKLTLLDEDAIQPYWSIKLKTSAPKTTFTNLAAVIARIRRDDFNSMEFNNYTAPVAIPAVDSDPAAVAPVDGSPAAGAAVDSALTPPPTEKPVYPYAFKSFNGKHILIVLSNDIIDKAKVEEVITYLNGIPEDKFIDQLRVKNILVPQQKIDVEAIPPMPSYTPPLPPLSKEPIINSFAQTAAAALSANNDNSAAIVKEYLNNISKLFTITNGQVNFNDLLEKAYAAAVDIKSTELMEAVAEQIKAFYTTPTPLDPDLIAASPLTPTLPPMRTTFQSFTRAAARKIRTLFGSSRAEWSAEDLDPEAPIDSEKIEMGPISPLNLAITNPSYLPTLIITPALKETIDNLDNVDQDTANKLLEVLTQLQKDQLTALQSRRDIFSDDDISGFQKPIIDAIQRVSNHLEKLAPAEAKAEATSEIYIDTAEYASAKTDLATRAPGRAPARAAAHSNHFGAAAPPPRRR